MSQPNTKSRFRRPVVIAILIAIIIICAIFSLILTLDGGGAPGPSTPLHTPPPIAPPALVPPETIVQAAFASLRDGHILYNPPTEMALEKKERVEVRITFDELTDELGEGLRGRGTPQIEDMQVSNFMKVRLLGDGFQIVPLSSEEQLVLENAITEWAWDVTPEDVGQQILTLVVTARVKIPGLSDEQKDLEVIERDIQVTVGIGSAVTYYAKRYWIWILLLVVVVAVLLGLRALSRRRRNTLQPASGIDIIESQDRETVLRQELVQHQSNADKLRDQLAVYVKGTEPIHLLNQLEEEEHRIREIEREIDAIHDTG